MQEEIRISSICFVLAAIGMLATVFLIEEIGIGLWLTTKLLFLFGFFMLIMKR